MRKWVPDLNEFLDKGKPSARMGRKTMGPLGIARFPKGKLFMLSQLRASVVKFLKSEDGPTAVEYAVMLALIIVVCITAITTLGTNANATFQTVAAQVGKTGS
jgi:pilus assembly protein Flp/PilA